MLKLSRFSTLVDILVDALVLADALALKLKLSLVEALTWLPLFAVLRLASLTLVLKLSL